MRRELLALLIESGVTTLFVSHDTEDALAMADKVVVLRDGKTEQMGTPAEAYRKPANSYVAKLLENQPSSRGVGRNRSAPLRGFRGGGELVSVRPGNGGSLIPLMIPIPQSLRAVWSPYTIVEGIGKSCWSGSASRSSRAFLWVWSRR